MPNHSSIYPRRLIPLLAAALAMLAGAAPARAVVGGTAVPQSTDLPFQAAMLNSRIASTEAGQVCGAVILDQRHLATAAHCVFNTPFSDSGQAARPSDIDVLVGTTMLGDGSGSRIPVSAVSFDPRFDVDYDYDTAVLTLDANLPTTDPSIQPIQIAQPLTPFSPGSTAVVSGWGATTKGTTPATSTYPPDLQAADVPLVDDSTCSTDYADVPPPPQGDTTVCAGDDQTDACFGDSGGPLARPPAAGEPLELIGIVSVGVGTCADAGHPGIYTEAPAGTIRQYLTDPRGDAPRSVTAPDLSGVAQVGAELTCGPGEWSGSPNTYQVQWVRLLDGQTVPVTAMGGADRYTATRQDERGRLRCDVKASSADGFGLRSSAYSAIISAAPAAAPSETPAPAPAPIPPAALKDTASPVARILTARCVRQTCTLTLRVSDAGVSAGIAKVMGSVRSTYRRDGRTRHRTRTFAARRTASTRFTVKLTKLPVGTQLFSLLATDKAGHRQLLPTRRTLTTKR